MKIAAVVLFAYVVFCSIWDPLLSAVVISNDTSLIAITSEPEPSGIRINIEAFLASCAFFLFSFILDYGRTLQQLSDESM